MNKYFKKFSIMFVMVLAIIGSGMIQNVSSANAAVGQKLENVDLGWQRYSYDAKEITYEGQGWFFDKEWAGNYLQKYEAEGAKIKFNFTGTKIRILSSYWHTYTTDADIKIDGNVIGKYIVYDNGKDIHSPIITYENLNLTNEEHSVEIINNTNHYLPINSIDIDKNEKLLPYDESISLDKSTINLTEGDSYKLTATTKPAAVGVTWKSSDTSIATIEVDPTNGKLIKVNAIKEGTCTITATTPDGLTATCTVTVTKESTPSNSGAKTDNQCRAITNSYGILNMNTASGFTQNNNNGGNGNSSNNSGNNNNSGNSGNNYSNNNNSNSNNNYYYYNNYYISFNTKA